MYNRKPELQPLYSSDEQPECVQVSDPHTQATTCLSSSIKQFNLKYNLMHSNYVRIPYLHRSSITLHEDSEPAYLLGVQYTQDTREQFLSSFQRAMWMCYRKGVDVGWGCMIRVVQMLFAEILKRGNPTCTADDVIEPFKQGTSALFSFENICEEASISERWAGANETVMAFVSLLQKYRSGKLNRSLPKTKISFNLNIQLHNERLILENFENYNEEIEFPKVVIISNKLASQKKDETLPSQCVAHLKHLMRLPTFCGMVGGVPGKALFIIGFQDEKAIILDPHYVQEESSPGKVCYFKKTPRGLPFSSLSSSFSLCFYFEELSSYKTWAAELCYSYKVYSPNLAIGLEVQDPTEVEKYRKRSEDFQDL